MANLFTIQGVLQVFLGNAIRDMRSVVQAGTQATGVMEGLGAAASRAGGLMAVAASAMAGMLTAAAISKMADFELKMRNVNSIARISEENFKSYSETIGQLGANMGLATSATENAAALYEIYSAGVLKATTETERMAEAQNFLVEASMAATGGLTNTKTAADVLTTIVNTYGQEAGSVTQINDKLFKTVEVGKVNYDQLAHSLGYVVGSAKASNISFDELLGTMAALTDKGLKASMAARNLRTLISALTNPSKAATEAMAKHNIIMNEQVLSQMGLAKAIQYVVEGTKGDQAALKAILRETTAVNAATLLASDSYHQLGSAIDQVANDSYGSLKRANAQIMASTVGQWNKLKVQIEAVVLSFSEKVLPMFQKLLAAANGWVEGFRNMDAATKAQVDRLIELVFNMDLWVAIGNLVVTTLRALLPALVEAAEGATVLINGFITLIDTFSGLLKAITPINDALGGLISSAFRELGNSMKGVLDGISNLMTGFGNLFGTTKGFDALKIAGEAVFAVLTGRFTTFIAKIKELQALWESIKGNKGEDLSRPESATDAAKNIDYSYDDVVKTWSKYSDVNKNKDSFSVLPQAYKHLKDIGETWDTINQKIETTRTMVEMVNRGMTAPPKGMTAATFTAEANDIMNRLQVVRGKMLEDANRDMGIMLRDGLAKAGNFLQAGFQKVAKGTGWGVGQGLLNQVLGTPNDAEKISVEAAAKSLAVWKNFQARKAANFYDTAEKEKEAFDNALKYMIAKSPEWEQAMLAKPAIYREAAKEREKIEKETNHNIYQDSLTKIEVEMNAKRMSTQEGINQLKALSNTAKMTKEEERQLLEKIGTLEGRLHEERKQRVEDLRKKQVQAFQFLAQQYAAQIKSVDATLEMYNRQGKSLEEINKLLDERLRLTLLQIDAEEKADVANAKTKEAKDAAHEEAKAKTTKAHADDQKLRNDAEKADIERSSKQNDYVNKLNDQKIAAIEDQNAALDKQNEKYGTNVDAKKISNLKKIDALKIDQIKRETDEELRSARNQSLGEETYTRIQEEGKMKILNILRDQKTTIQEIMDKERERAAKDANPIQTLEEAMGDINKRMGLGQGTYGSSNIGRDGSVFGGTSVFTSSALSSQASSLSGINVGTSLSGTTSNGNPAGTLNAHVADQNINIHITIDGKVMTATGKLTETTINALLSETGFNNMVLGANNIRSGRTA